MKRNFLLLMSALVIGMMMTGCSKDDEGAALTRIRVSPESLQIPVGESQKVTVTAVPDNATGVSYEWTSSDENVAKVSQDGTVTAIALGTATVTVKSGDIKTDIPVTATLKSLTVKDANGASVGTYPYTDGLDPITFTLTATVEPAGVKPEWTVDVSTVTVVASSNGLSATVTVKGEGLAIVSVTAGGLTATYTITTSSLLETANGYWEFDDPTNLFKATVGTDLMPDKYDDAPEDIHAVDGPSAGNGAAAIPKYTYLKAIHGIAPNGLVHNDTEGRIQRVNEYTVMFDVKVEQEAYYALMQNNIKDDLKQADEASFYLKPSGRLGGGSFTNSPDDSYTVGNWHRVILACKFNEEGWFDYYVDGVHIKATEEQEHSGTVGIDMVDHNRFAVHPNGILFFADTRPGDPYEEAGDGYDYNDGLSVSGIAIWDHPLTAVEVAALGGVE